MAGSKMAKNNPISTHSYKDLVRYELQVVPGIGKRRVWTAEKNNRCPLFEHSVPDATRKLPHQSELSHGTRLELLAPSPLGCFDRVLVVFADAKCILFILRGLFHCTDAIEDNTAE